MNIFNFATEITPNSEILVINADDKAEVAIFLGIFNDVLAFATKHAFGMEVHTFSHDMFNMIMNEREFIVANWTDNGWNEVEYDVETVIPTVTRLEKIKKIFGWSI